MSDATSQSARSVDLMTRASLTAYHVPAAWMILRSRSVPGLNGVKVHVRPSGEVRTSA